MLNTVFFIALFVVILPICVFILAFCFILSLLMDLLGEEKNKKTKKRFY